MLTFSAGVVAAIIFATYQHFPGAPWLFFYSLSSARPSVPSTPQRIYTSQGMTWARSVGISYGNHYGDNFTILISIIFTIHKKLQCWCCRTQWSHWRVMNPRLIKWLLLMVISSPYTGRKWYFFLPPIYFLRKTKVLINFVSQDCGQRSCCFHAAWPGG